MALATATKGSPVMALAFEKWTSNLFLGFGKKIICKIEPALPNNFSGGPKSQKDMGSFWRFCDFEVSFCVLRTTKKQHYKLWPSKNWAEIYLFRNPEENVEEQTGPS